MSYCSTFGGEFPGFPPGTLLTSPSVEDESSSSGISARKVDATERSASSGQAENQSIVQQFTSDGNCRSLARNTSPIGLCGEGTGNTCHNNRNHLGSIFVDRFFVGSSSIVFSANRAIVWFV